MKSENEFKLAADKARGMVAERRRISYVTEAGSGAQHATEDDPGRTRNVTTLCARGVTISGSQDAPPREGLCEDCSDEIERRRKAAREGFDRRADEETRL